MGASPADNRRARTRPVGSRPADTGRVPRGTNPAVCGGVVESIEHVLGGRRRVAGYTRSGSGVGSERSGGGGRSPWFPHTSTVVTDKAGAVTFKAEDPYLYTQKFAFDPYAYLFGGVSSTTFLSVFPWQYLQVVKS